MLTTADINASLQKYWDTNGIAGLLTVFSGTEIDVSNEETWIEFWVSQLFEAPKRPGSPRQMLVSIDVHIFSRAVNKRAINAHVDSVRTAFHPTSIPLFSATVATTQVGYLRFTEPVVRDASRAKSIGSSNNIQHFIVSLNATALGLTS